MFPIFNPVSLPVMTEHMMDLFLSSFHCETFAYSMLEVLNTFATFYAQIKNDWTCQNPDQEKSLRKKTPITEKFSPILVGLN